MPENATSSLPRQKTKYPHKWFLLLSPLLALIGLQKFSTAFFLAKKSLPQSSTCEEDSASNLLFDVLGIEEELIAKLEDLGILSSEKSPSSGCWMPRRAEAMAIIVVDALRFDFALEHLPKSVGARLQSEKIRQTNVKKAKDETAKRGINSNINEMALGQSQLYQFVADPPTVTMQRLKGLTTGGLPTFADISGSFGGANVDEDSWVQQLRDVPISKRGGSKSKGTSDTRRARMAFVGDDTWVDLFPNQFDDSHPYPSFNTRDLDTVDEGCLLHLPRLLKQFGRPKDENAIDGESYFELLVTHFLGVDHVGHTYGPHNM